MMLGWVGVKIGVKGHPPLRFPVSLGDGTHELEVLREKSRVTVDVYHIILAVSMKP
jgi:hypothetical protein